MIPQSLDIATLFRAYRDGADPHAVVTGALGRLDALDDPGIFISHLPRRDIDRLIDDLGPFDPERRPLWGLPFAIKDNIDLAGLPTTAACPAFAYAPKTSAEAVRRLIAAGAIPLGKTNLDQFATGLVGLRSPYPIPRNAFDPRIVPGGSSSGSAIAVARGIVSFALGTDTAGSGRVPAGLNNLVGLKPTLGAVPVRGVTPACQTLDCVSVFALTVPDAWQVFTTMAGYDADDPWSRRIAIGQPTSTPAGSRLGVPDGASRVFGGDRLAEAAFDGALARLQSLGHRLVAIDLGSFFAAAKLLYQGAWVAERYQAIRDFIRTSPEAMHPTTLRITRGAESMSAADAFAGLYRLADLRRATEPVWEAIDALVVPTYPRPVTCAEVEADPIGPNASLGVYTNFVNLLDLAALAVPGAFRDDGFPSGVTFIGQAGSDAALASIGSAFHAAAATPLGATGVAQPDSSNLPPGPGIQTIEIVVVGAHLSGLPLNHQLVALGGTHVRAAVTASDYKLFSLPNTQPPKPGLHRVGPGEGASIAVEVWALPIEGFGRFVAAIPPPLSIGTVRLSDGTAPKGFLCEFVGLQGALDISAYGGWRGYLESPSAP